jgi:hypothetical protein
MPVFQLRDRSALPIEVIEAELLKESGNAAGHGQNPFSFAKDFVRRGGGLSVDEAVRRLIDTGVAKSRWLWS